MVNDGYLDRHRERDRRPIRFLVFGIVVILVFGTLTTRLAYLQLVNGATFTSQADANRTATQALPAPRGLIYDRNGRLLVSNVPSFAVKIRPADLPLSRREEVVARLGALIGVDPAEINTTIDLNPGSRFDFVRVAQDIPQATASIVAESADELPGVSVVVETRREYADGPLTAHILGYTGPVDPGSLAELKSEGYLPDDLLGKTGLEATFESELRGTYGQQLLEKDATGRTVQVLSTVSEAVPGASLTLTIDSKAQQDATTALLWGMKEAGLKRGVVIAMNPQTGEILALVSLPAYDNNAFAKGISNTDFQALLEDPDKPLTNHAVQAHYPPGSTYKLVTGTGGLADGEINATTQLLTRPYLTLGSTKFYEWNRRGWGLCNLDCGFGHSSDTFFYQVAGMLGIDRLGYWANQFGFGQRTGIDLLGEARGIVPTNEWKINALGDEVFPGEVYQAGIGQGYDVVTPIQVLNAYAALANGGHLYRPQLVREIVGPDGTVLQPFAPDLLHDLDLDPAVLREMREAARTTVTLRHTYNLVDLPVKVAGKSGTAEFGTRDSKGRLPFHSWFVGFTPKDPVNGSFSDPDSELVVLAFAYDSRTKGNVATEIVKYFMQLHYGIEKDYRNFDLLERGNFYQSN
ncbi:MAG: penicillin-binding protein 2 [Chloroflexi bacterium]|nr:MAG: penicillin-binding protein 2 [Chloroflexota bacterium]